VTLADVTREAVLDAVAEYDRVGRDAFLEGAGFGRALGYFLEVNGQLYDSKAIVGYAHGVSGGAPLRADDFTGGDATVARRLRALGFVVRTGRNPDWTRDEIILACALVEANGWRQLDDADPRVAELSRILQSPAIHPVDARGWNFRNPAGVARKTADIATRHPDYTGKPTNGNRLDREVLDDFIARPDEMRATAEAIGIALTAAVERDPGPVPDPDLDDSSADEGDVLRREHLRRERNPGLRRSKLTEAKRRGLPIACEVCGFDFCRTYGERGRDFIECHHRTPLNVTGKVKTKLADLALICSNCHRMIHRTRDWLTIEQLAELLRSARG
jgi:5-methylcytosine-specific restriction enzyme A